MSEAQDKISSLEVGEGTQRVVFIHGLMGRGRNFLAIAKQLGEEYRSLLLDVPNHGDSGWTDHFSYIGLADTIAEFLENGFAKDGPVHVIGHSMGGKIAMVLALRHPHLVNRLVVEDIGPVNSRETGSEFTHLLGSLASVDFDQVKSRSDVDAVLTEPINDKRVRGFLMQNLRTNGEGGYQWQCNLDVLLRDMDAVVGFPMLTEEPFPNPTLWVGGSNSSYVRYEDLPKMKALFPNVRRMTVKDAGHWVHSEQPERFLAILRHFFGSPGW